MAFNAGGTIVFSYTDGTERWELRVPCADFDPVTFAYTGTGRKVPTEADIAATVANFGGVWAPYFDPTWTLTLEALYHQSGGTGTRLATLPSVADVTGTSSTPSSANPPLMRGFTFTLDKGGRQVVRFFSVATTTTGARREVTATSGGFDSRDQALMAYLAGPSTGLVAWDGQVFPPTATAYQRFKLAPFERGGGGGGSSPPGDCITFPRGATICNDAADVVHVRTPGATHALDTRGYQLPSTHRVEAFAESYGDPAYPPVLSAVDQTAVGVFSGWPAGTYHIAYTLSNALGETRASPAAVITIAQDVRIQACLPPSLLAPDQSSHPGYPFADQLPGDPPDQGYDPSEVVRYYLMAYSPGAPDVHLGNLIGWTASCVLLDNFSTPGAFMPPSVNTAVTWGWRVVAPDHSDLLHLPLPQLGATPATLVGQDPATLLPSFCPAPVPTTTTIDLGGGGGGQPAPSSTCVQVRCGVSAVLRDHLLSLYIDWSAYLDPLFQACASFGVAVAVASIPWDWIADLGLASAAGAIKGGIVSLLFSFGSVITGNLLPALDPDLRTQIQQAAFDALACTGDQVQVSAANITDWQSALNALTTWPISSLAGPFCGLLLQYTPLAAWQGAAASASPSHVCDAWP